MGKFGLVSGQAITLANSIIGVGILAMPFCFQQCGIVLSIVLLILSSFMSRLASHFLLKSAIKSRRRNFEVLAFHVFGNAGKFCVEIGIIGFMMGTCIAYFVVVGDLGPQIIAKMFGINYSNHLRTGVMVMVSLFCILPMGLLKNVDSLSNVCVITIVFYFCLVLKIAAEAANPLFSGEWIKTVEYWKPDGILRCLPIFSMSLFCQTQLFEIYDMLPNASLEKMNVVTKNAVTICTVVYILVGVFGYIAFYDQSILGNILTNFSPTIMTDAIKMGFVMSLAFSFPLIIFPCRVSLYSLLYKKGQVGPHDLISNLMPDSRFKYLTVFIISTTLLISLMLPNIELVLGFVGSTIGVIICVIFPATCFICITIKNTNERILAQIVLCFGIIIMVLGTYANLQATEIDNINSRYKLEIKQNKFENKILKDFRHDVSKNKEDIKLEKQIVQKIINEKMESRLEPPNPIAPKEDSNIKQSLVEKISNLSHENIKKDTIIKTLDTNDKKDKSDMKENNKNVKSEIVQSLDNKENDSIIKNKNDEIKKQDLIETIKRHEKEQREIIQEQKEILKEIKKTQKELEEENHLKKVADNTLNEIENKKIAVENIQKLAKLAIESLGGKLDIVTEKSDQSIKKILSSTEKLVNENNEKKINNIDDDRNRNSNISKVLHIHKEDEPDSYKLGESLKELKINKDINDGKSPKPVLVVKPPIPIALSMIKENVKAVQSNNQPVEKETNNNVINNEEPNQDDVNINQNSYIGAQKDILKKMNIPYNNPNILSEQKEIQSNLIEKTNQKLDEPNISEKNYIGGKRDILEIHEKNSITENRINNRPKREIESCEEGQKLKNELLNLKQDESDNEIDLKLSITLTEPENKMRKQSSIYTINSSKTDLIKQAIVNN